MTRVNDHRFPSDNHETVPPSERGEMLAGQFIASGIDDLAKYRIVRLLYDYQSLVGNVALFAAYLGFHSREVTTTLLNELVTRGILDDDRACGRCRRYRLADDDELRRRLVRLYNAPVWACDWERALQILAGRSLHRAMKRALAAARRVRAGHVGGRTRPPDRGGSDSCQTLRAGADTTGGLSD